jgi:hypothetical protein
MQITLSHRYPDGSWHTDFTCDSLDPKLTQWVNTYIRNDVEWTVMEAI